MYSCKVFKFKLQKINQILIMAQFNSCEIYSQVNYGKREKKERAYYSYNEELYAGTFPEDWSKNHAPGTGPKNCNNCAYFGMWNGVFLGYCANCADHIYNGERGRGFIRVGIENSEKGVLKYSSAFDSYLRDVKLDDVGDSDLYDSASIIMQISREAFKKRQTEAEAEAEAEAEETYSEESEQDIDSEVSYFDEDSCDEFPSLRNNGYGSNCNGGYNSH